MDKGALAYRLLRITEKDIRRIPYFETQLRKIVRASHVFTQSNGGMPFLPRKRLKEMAGTTRLDLCRDRVAVC
jgi:hypothetical protein